MNPDWHNYGFDEQGEPVPVVLPSEDCDLVEDNQADSADAIRAARVEGMTLLLRLLLEDARSAEKIGERAVLLAYLHGLEYAPAKSVREIGDYLGVSATRAHQLLTCLKEKLNTETQCLQG